MFLKNISRIMLVSFILALQLFWVMPAFASLQSDLDEANAAAESAKAEYDAAVAQQTELQGQIDALNVDIANAEAQMPERQARADKAICDMYKSEGDIVGLLESVLVGDNLADVLANFEFYERMSKWRINEVNQLTQAKAQLETDRANVETAKTAQDEEVDRANAAMQEAIDAQGKARDALAAAQAAAQTVVVRSSAPTARAATSSSWGDEESAKAYIIGKESGGNYQARNGRYYGAYQLTESYLGGDYSPENQDAVAQRYVEGRYGSWTGAAQFWDSHGWY